MGLTAPDAGRGVMRVWDGVPILKAGAEDEAGHFILHKKADDKVMVNLRRLWYTSIYMDTAVR